MSRSFEEAVVCINQGRLVDSLHYFELALGEAPRTQHHVIHCNVGSALLALDDLPSALAAFDEALELSPLHLESLVNRGIVKSRLGDFSAALHSFSKACEVSSSSLAFHPALCGKSEALAQLGRYEEAIASAQEACQLVPSNALGFADLGFALLKNGQFAPAIEALTTSLELGDEEDEENRELLCVALTQRAVELEMAGERVPAWEHVHRANALYRKSNPTQQQPQQQQRTYAKNLHNEGILLLALQREEEALDCFLLAVKRNPRHFDARLALGTLLAKLDYLPDAEEHLQAAACEVDLTSVEARFNLGVVRAKMGNTPGARADWEFILHSIQPEEPHAVEALRLLEGAMKEAKAKGSDGRKETMEVAVRIAGLCNNNNATRRVTIKPLLPNTHLILEQEGSSEVARLKGMSAAASDALLGHLDALTNHYNRELLPSTTTTPSSSNSTVQENGQQVRQQAETAAHRANNTADDDLLLAACTNAANLAGVAATHAFAFAEDGGGGGTQEDAGQRGQLVLGLLEGAVVAGQAALVCGKRLLEEGDDDKTAWIESVAHSTRESQQVCEQVCKSLLQQQQQPGRAVAVPLRLTSAQQHQVRALQQASRDAQLLADGLVEDVYQMDDEEEDEGEDGEDGTASRRASQDAAAAVPLLLTHTDGHTVLGEDGAALHRFMTTTTALQDDAALDLLALAGKRCQASSASAINLANLAGVTAATAHALAERNPALALQLAQSSLQCASRTLESSSPSSDASHAAAVAVMEAADICSSALAIIQDVFPALHDECAAGEELAGAVHAQASQHATAAKSAAASPRLPGSFQPAAILLVPFTSRVLRMPSVLAAREFTKPRPLVMVHPRTGEVVGVSAAEGHALLKQVDGLFEHSSGGGDDQQQHQLAVERGAQALMAKTSSSSSRANSSSSTADEVAGLASLTDALAAHSHFLAESNPELAIRAATVAVRSSLASLGTIDAGELDQADMGDALCKMAYNSATICSDTCARVLDAAQPHSDLWRHAHDSNELAAQAMKLSLDIAKQVSDTRAAAAQATGGGRTTPLLSPVTPLVMPFRAVPAALPSRLPVQALRSPRPLILTDARTGQVLGLSQPDSDDLLARLHHLDHAAITRAEDSEALIAKAEASTQETLRNIADAANNSSSSDLAGAAARSANWAGVTALSAHELAESGGADVLAVRAAKVSLCSSLASLDALETRNGASCSSVSDCDVSLSAAQAVMESAAIVAAAMDLVVTQPASSAEVLAEAQACRTEANSAWDKASAVAKKASQAKTSDEYRAQRNKHLVAAAPVLVPLPARAVQALPSRVDVASLMARRSPLVVLAATRKSSNDGEQAALAGWLGATDAVQAANELEREAERLAHGDASSSPTHALNVGNVACFQAAELVTNSPGDAHLLAVATAAAGLKCALAGLDALQHSDEYASAAAKLVMEASAKTRQVCAAAAAASANGGDSAATAECAALADEAMQRALDVAIAAGGPRSATSEVIQAMAVPFASVSAATPGRLTAAQPASRRPLLIVRPADGSLVGMRAADESQAVLLHVDQLLWHETGGDGVDHNNTKQDALAQATQHLLALAASSSAPAAAKEEDERAMRHANLAAVLAAHADALAATTSSRPELAMEATAAALRQVDAALSSSQPASAAVVRSALQTANILTDVCVKMQSSTTAQDQARRGAAEANRLAKLAIDAGVVAQQHRGGRGGAWNEPVVIPLHRALRPTTTTSIRSTGHTPRAPSRTASLETLKTAQDTLLQVLRASEACQEAQDVFGRGDEEGAAADGGRKSLARSCARTAGNAASVSLAAAGLAHRLAELDPALAMQLTLAAMHCSNKALDASQDALRGDSLNSDVAFRVSTQTSDTARLCIDTSRLVLASRRAKANYALSEQAAQGIRSASELTRRAIQEQNNCRVVLGSAAYQEAKARLRRAVNVKKRQSMWGGGGGGAAPRKSVAAVRSGSNANTTSQPTVFGQGLLKRTGVQLVDLPASSGGDAATAATGFGDVEHKLLRSVLRERSEFKDRFASSAASAAAAAAASASQQQVKLHHVSTVTESSAATAATELLGFARPLSPVYQEPGTGGIFFPFADLKTPNCPAGVDPARKELYLADGEFAKVFQGKTKAQFMAAPAWRRTREKQTVGIF